MAHFDGGSADVFEADLSDFEAIGFDIVDGGGAGTVIFNGYLDAILVATQAFAGTGSYLFNAVFGTIDRLEIVYGNTGHFTVDNLQLDGAVGLSEVPEPATIGMFGVGLLAVAAAHRRRRAPRASKPPRPVLEWFAGACGPGEPFTTFPIQQLDCRTA